MFNAVPDEWRVVELAELATIKTGRTPNTKEPAYWEGEVPFVTPSDITDAIYPERVERFLTDSGAAASILAPAGAVLFTCIASIGKACILAAPSAFNQQINACIPKPDVDSYFLFHALKARTEHFKDMAGTTAVPIINKSTFGSTHMSLPPLDEQRRIAEVLRSVDEAITTADEVTKHFGTIIQREADAVVARLLADGAVKSVKLGELAHVRGGKRLPKGSEYEKVPTGNPYVRVTDWDDYEISPLKVRWISDDVAASIRRYTISSRDLFISIAGSIGLVAPVPAQLNGAYLTENAAKIVIRDAGAVDLTYLLVALRSGPLADQIRQQKGVGGGVPKLALFRIEELVLPLPPIEMQREIAASYLGLKAARARSREALLSARTLKADLAADLLSGSIRVPA